jgi:hypothetical protein
MIAVVSGDQMVAMETTMTTISSTARQLGLIVALVLSLAMLSSASHAFTLEDQKRLCTGDVFRLCSSEIPNVDRITTCMRRQKVSLSEDSTKNRIEQHQ